MNFLFALLVCLLLVFLAVVAVRARRRQAASTEWEVLLRRLAAIDRDAIERIAYSDEEPFATATEQGSEIWFRQVGWKGLDDLQNNCAVMVDMARHIQSRYPEGVIVAEQLRLTARQIEWHLNRVRLASQAGHFEECFREYGNRAICLYFDMTQTLKVLYRELRIAEREQLEALL